MNGVRVTILKGAYIVTRRGERHDRSGLRWVLFALFEIVLALGPLPAPLVGQATLSEHMISGIKGLRSLAIGVRMNDQFAVASAKEMADIIEVALHRSIPELHLSNSDSSSSWLELNVVAGEDGGMLELSTYRWVRVLESGIDIFTKVWWDQRVIVGTLSRHALQENIESLATSFAADVIRAKHP